MSVSFVKSSSSLIYIFRLFSALFLIAFEFLSEIDDGHLNLLRCNLANSLNVNPLNLNSIQQKVLQLLDYEIFLSEDQFAIKMKVIEKKLFDM